MKKILLPLLILLSHQASALAVEREWAPYRKVIENLRFDKVNALPASQRDKVIFYMTVTPDNKNIKQGDVVLTVVHAGGKQAFQVGADGRVDLPFKQQWLNEEAKMTINQPVGEKMGLGYGIDAVMPNGTQWQYASLMGSVKQSNDLVKSVAGMLSMLVPKTKSVVLVFAKPAQVKIQAKDGLRTLTSDAKNKIRIKPEDALMQENAQMTLSERPLEAELDNE